MSEITAEQLEAIERQLRRGLGPEAPLVDIFKRGIHVQRFLASEGGRAIIDECSSRIVQCMEDLTQEGMSPEEDQRALVAFKLNIAILRRMAALIAVGEQAGDSIEHLQSAPRE